MVGGGASRDDAADDRDPFDGVTFDEDFVRAATVKEAPASLRDGVADVPYEHGHHPSEDIGEDETEHPPWRRTRAGRLTSKAVAGAVLLALVGGAWLSSGIGTARRSPAPHSDVQTSAVRLTGELPPPPADEGPARVRAASPLPAGRGEYEFIRKQPGSPRPVAYDPCQPLHVVVNGRTAPPEGPRLVAAALERLEAATGLALVEDGATTERPARGRAPYQPARYPGRWAPVLVSWSDPEEYPQLAGDAAGFGGSTSVSLPGSDQWLYVTGQVTLDGPQLSRLLERRDGAARVRSIILHELGHLAGLGHVDDSAQIMNPAADDVEDYAAGDLTGLALLGRGDCFPGI